MQRPDYQGRQLYRLCLRIKAEDDKTLRDMCEVMGMEYNLLVRSIIGKFCINARADALKKIDATTPGASNDESDIELEAFETAL